MMCMYVCMSECIYVYIYVFICMYIYEISLIIYVLGIAINQGLLALGNVIEALSKKSLSASDCSIHIPYRDAKITRYKLISMSPCMYIICL